MYRYLFGIKFINMYGLMIGIGILACFYLLEFLGKKREVDPKFINFTEYNGIICIIGGFLSAAVFQGFYNYLNNPADGFHISIHNITFMGGLIGGIIVFLIGYYTYGVKHYGFKLNKVLEIAPPCITIAHAFGRLGCFCAGCCHGIESHTIFDMHFPANSIDPGNWLPTQLYEAVFLFIITAVMVILILKKKFRYSFTIYLTAYGIFRFLIEYIRGDNRGSFIPGLTPSQFWSIPMVIGAVAMYFAMKEIGKREAKKALASINTTANEESVIEETNHEIPTVDEKEEKKY